MKHCELELCLTSGKPYNLNVCGWIAPSPTGLLSTSISTGLNGPSGNLETLLLNLSIFSIKPLIPEIIQFIYPLN